MQILKTDFIPVALDQAYQRRQKDAEGEFYRKIAGQGPRATPGFRGTTQGFYVVDAAGKLLLYNNNRDPEKVHRLLRQKRAEFQKPAQPQLLADGEPDARYNPAPPQGGLVVRVRAKVLDGYQPTDDRWRKIFQTAVSRDNLWISHKEHQALAAGQVPKTLQQRIARFHLVDNTRGEPPMWRESEIRSLEMTLKNGQLQGRVQLRTDSGDRGYEAELLGEVKTENGKVTAFQLIAKGKFWGEGPYTRRAPAGKFPLAVSFVLADGSDIADAIPPQGSRGRLPGYIGH